MLPAIKEGKTLDAALINGVDIDALTAHGQQKVSVTFVDENAAYENTVGYVSVDASGNLGTGGVVFQNLDGQDRGGGPLTPGATVDIGTFDDGTSVDIFVIPNGNALGIDFADGAFSFRATGGGPANIADTSPPQLVFTANDGSETIIHRPVFHTAGAGLNPRGAEQVISATDADGSTLLSFEDLVTGATGFDGDFNDATLDVTFSDDDDTEPVDDDDGLQDVTSPDVTLDDGQTVALQITTEDTTDDDVAELSGVLSLTGFLSSNFNIAYVMDVSGSTFGLALDENFAPIDLNGDGINDTVLTAEQLAFAELNDQLAGNGLGNADLAVITFDDTGTLEITTSVAADADGDGVADGVNAINNPSSAGGGTNYAPALQDAIDFFNGQADVGTATNVVYFLSDGEPNQFNFQDEIDELQDPNGIGALVNAIGAGSGADQSVLDGLDNTGGSEIFTDLSQLVAGLSGSSLDIDDILSVDIIVNGTTQATLDSSAFTDTPTGLQFGPVTLTGLDPTAVNTLAIEAVLQTDSGMQFQLDLMTEIVGSAAPSVTTSIDQGLSVSQVVDSMVMAEDALAA